MTQILFRFPSISIFSSANNFPHCQFFRTDLFGWYSIAVSAVKSWNQMPKQIEEVVLQNLTSKKIQIQPTRMFINSYES